MFSYSSGHILGSGGGLSGSGNNNGNNNGNESENIDKITENKQFQKEYICFPMTYLEVAGKKSHREVNHLERMDKIIMPSSALKHLINFNISSPYTFRLTSSSTGLSCYCGVQDYDNEDRSIYVPSKLMDTLFIAEGQKVCLDSVSLPIGESVVLKVQSEFLKLQAPDIILQKELRNIATLSLGQVLEIEFVRKKYKIEVVKINKMLIRILITTLNQLL